MLSTEKDNRLQYTTNNNNMQNMFGALYNLLEDYSKPLNKAINYIKIDHGGKIAPQSCCSLSKAHVTKYHSTCL